MKLRSVLGTILAGTLLLSVGCSSSNGSSGPAASDPGTGTSAPAPAMPKQFVIGASAETATFFPPKTGSHLERYTFEHTFDALLHHTPDGKTVGRLAETWKKVDDTTWEFKLRQGVKFQNGDPLTAEDVQFSIDQFRDPKTSVVASRFGTIKEIKIVDVATIQMITKQPDPFLPNAVTDNGWIMPKKYLTEKGVDYFAAHPIGTGPYTFKEWVKGDHITWEANKEYWNGKPKFETLVWRNIPDPASRVAALLNGELDIIWEVPPSMVDQLKGGNGIQVKSRPSSRSVYLGLWADSPQGGGAPLKDPRVRQALNYAVNRQVIVDTLLKGYGTLISQPVPSDAYLGYNSQIKPYPYDPQKAKELLAAAGFKDGFTLNVDFNERYMTREQLMAVAADLEKVGIKLNLKQREYGDWVKVLTQDKAQAPIYALSIQGTVVIDANEIYSVAVVSGGSFNWNKYSNPQADDLIKKMSTTFDDKERAELGKQVAQLTYDNPPWIYLWNNSSIWALKKGWKWDPRADELLDVQDDVSW